MSIILFEANRNFALPSIRGYPRVVEHSLSYLRSFFWSHLDSFHFIFATKQQYIDMFWFWLLPQSKIQSYWTNKRVISLRGNHMTQWSIVSWSKAASGISQQNATRWSSTKAWLPFVGLPDRQLAIQAVTYYLGWIVAFLSRSVLIIACH